MEIWFLTKLFLSSSTCFLRLLVTALRLLVTALRLRVTAHRLLVTALRLQAIAPPWRQAIILLVIALRRLATAPRLQVILPKIVIPAVMTPEQGSTSSAAPRNKALRMLRLLLRIILDYQVQGRQGTLPRYTLGPRVNPELFFIYFWVLSDIIVYVVIIQPKL